MCRCCRVTKDVVDFSPERANRDGLKSYCKPCQAARKRAYRVANRDKMLSQEAAWRLAHPWIPKPRQTPDPGTPEWELRRAYAKRVAASRWHAKQLHAKVNDLRLRDWLAALDEHGRQCFYCGSSEEIQIEHLVPLWSGGDNTRSNVVPACKSCNWKKRLRTVEQFMTNHCSNDHEMTSENTYRYPDSRKTACRKCQHASQVRYRERNRQRASSS